jgi:phosphatidate phosphatase APP1
VKRLHRAARIDDGILAWRHARGVKRGLVPTVVPFAGYGSTAWVRVLCRVVLTKPEIEDAPERSARGWRSFTSIPVVSSKVTVRIGTAERTVVADRGGLVDAVVEADLSPGWQEISLSADGSDPVTAPVFIVAPDVRFGVLSDIDDTVMVTALPRPFVAAWNTFVLDEHARTPVPGMAVMYERIMREHEGSPMIYLSTGAWNVASTLTRFLSRNLYPDGSILLTDWGPTPERIFRSGREHKRTNLLRLAQEFPDIQWLLVGDDGQHDEDLYGDFAANHPENVRAVAIRQLSASEAVLAGGRSKAEEHGGDEPPWVYAPDGAALLDQLSRHGVA